jgi:hypothetical protein
MTDPEDPRSSVAPPRWADSPDGYRVLPERVPPEQTVALHPPEPTDPAADSGMGLDGGLDGGDGGGGD